MYPLHPGHPGTHGALLVLLSLVVVATALALTRALVLGSDASSAPSEG